MRLFGFRQPVVFLLIPFSFSLRRTALRRHGLPAAPLYGGCRIVAFGSTKVY